MDNRQARDLDNWITNCGPLEATRLQPLWRKAGFSLMDYRQDRNDEAWESVLAEPRFVVSANLPPNIRREGWRFEVVDLRHPGDGGPVAISWHHTREEAEAAAIKAAEEA